MEFRTKFEKVMNEKGLTRYDIATKTGFTLKRIDGYIQGKVRISNLRLNVVCVLADVLNCTIDEILEDDFFESIKSFVKDKKEKYK
jgi:transcriptional regulator with XRE-family HTH domain